MTNIAIITGRLARDPEARTTQGGTSVTGITVVTDRPLARQGRSAPTRTRRLHRQGKRVPPGDLLQRPR